MGLAEKSTLAVIRRACDWQLRNLPTHWPTSEGERRRISDRGWIRGAFFAGLLAAWRALKEPRYLRAATRWAEKNRWHPGPRTGHADDHCVGQTYLDLYFHWKEERMLAPIRAAMDDLLKAERPGRELWWWCDALFMAPPVLAKLAAVTGRRRYLQVLHRLWWDASEELLDREWSLYYRDANFKVGEGNSQKVFWSRGNGWVMAGLVRVLEHLPAEDPARPRYTDLLRQMAAAVVRQWPEGGLWSPSLLDPQSFPTPETSGSGLFCYALAWGVNHGVLERARYKPVIEQVWARLVEAVDDSGRLGWVQRPGVGPAPVAREDSMEYGTGALLLAGSQVLEMSP